MTEGVKAGQVWQHKNRGFRVTLGQMSAGYMFPVTRDDGTEDVVTYSVLVDDYMLVRDAP